MKKIKYLIIISVLSILFCILFPPYTIKYNENIIKKGYSFLFNLPSYNNIESSIDINIYLAQTIDILSIFTILLLYFFLFGSIHDQSVCNKGNNVDGNKKNLYLISKIFKRFHFIKKISSEEFAYFLYNFYLNTLYDKLKTPNNLNNKEIINECFRNPKKQHIQEFPYICLYLIYMQIVIRFPENSYEIIKHLERYLNDIDLSHLKMNMKYYQDEWWSALKRENFKEDESPLNNPVYCISNLASKRSYGTKEHHDLKEIEEFVEKFIKDLDKKVKSYKVIQN